MLKKLFLCTILFFTMTNVYALDSKVVNNQEELKEALSDSKITTITLGSNIDTTEKINITRPVTIDGAGYTIRYVGKFGSSQSSSNTVWGGIYVLHFYKTTGTLRNIKLTGGNAGLLINGSQVKLEGIIDVSGNGFGGIELGKGSGVTNSSHAILDSDTKLVNTTESSDNPTLWVPKDTDDSILEIDGVKQELEAGNELSLDEIIELFDIEENPETSDPIIIYSITFILSILTLIFIKQKKTILN